MPDKAPEERIIATDDDGQISRAIWGLEDARRRTRKLLATVAPAALDWIPPDGGNTIGTLIYHLAAIEMSYLYEDILEQQWAPELDPILPYEIRTGNGRLTSVSGETMATHLGRLDESRTLLLATLSTISIEEFRRPRPVEQYIITPEWICHHLMQHEAEHRGQIAELRRRAEQETRSTMNIKRSGSQPSARGPEEWFTGTVRIDPLFTATAPARTAGNAVTFEPGARTAWHTHPLGQTLIVTSGCGWAQHEGGPVEVIRPGDVVWFPPGEKHWHGATATSTMTHIAVQEALDGIAVEWLEKVGDEEYRAAGDR